MASLHEHFFGRGEGAVDVGVGSLLSVLLESGPTVGTSGAIFGFMGCTAAFLHRYRHRYYLRDARIVVVLLAWAVFSLATGWFNPRIANMAHLGGLVAGSALAIVFRPRQCISA